MSAMKEMLLFGLVTTGLIISISLTWAAIKRDNPSIFWSGFVVLSLTGLVIAVMK